MAGRVTKWSKDTDNPFSFFFISKFDLKFWAWTLNFGSIKKRSKLLFPKFSILQSHLIFTKELQHQLKKFSISAFCARLHHVSSFSTFCNACNRQPVVPNKFITCQILLSCAHVAQKTGYHNRHVCDICICFMLTQIWGLAWNCDFLCSFSIQ